MLSNAVVSAGTALFVKNTEYLGNILNISNDLKLL